MIIPAHLSSCGLSMKVLGVKKYFVFKYGRDLLEGGSYGIRTTFTSLQTHQFCTQNLKFSYHDTAPGGNPWTSPFESL